MKRKDLKKEEETTLSCALITPCDFITSVTRSCGGSRGYRDSDEESTKTITGTSTSTSQYSYVYYVYFSIKLMLVGIDPMLTHIQNSYIYINYVCTGIN